MVEPLQLRFVILPMLLQIWQLDKGPATVRNTTIYTDPQIVHYSKNFGIEYDKYLTSQIYLNIFFSL